MFQITICVMGEDKRQDYLAQYLQEQGFIVKRHARFSPAILVGADILIGPVTIYKNGKLLPEIEEACNKEKVSVLNYMASEDFLLRNAELTAEGFLALLIQNTPFSLKEANILLLGLGRCGKALKKLLGKMDAHVDAYDVVPDKIPTAQSYRVVINTIPAPVISRDHLETFHPDCILFDIASAPGGFDKEAVEELALNLITCPGIPGKFSPQSAGYAIGESAIGFLN